MSKHLENDLDRLHRMLLALAALVEEAIETAMQSLRHRDCGLARSVVDGDDRIDRLENDIRDECLKILALHQPVAVDLRRIGVVLMIVTDLERMGDGAVGIAERAKVLARLPAIPIPPRLGEMADRAAHIVRASIDAFVHLDPQEAGRIILMDDEVDRDNVELIEQVVMEMKDNPTLIEQGLSLFSAVRALERIADHATNIAEDVIYLVKGEIVRHRPQTPRPERPQ